MGRLLTSVMFLIMLLTAATFINGAPPLRLTRPRFNRVIRSTPPSQAVRSAYASIPPAPASRLIVVEDAEGICAQPATTPDDNAATPPSIALERNTECEDTQAPTDVGPSNSDGEPARGSSSAVIITSSRSTGDGLDPSTSHVEVNSDDDADTMRHATRTGDVGDDVSILAVDEPPRRMYRTWPQPVQQRRPLKPPPISTEVVAADIDPESEAGFSSQIKTHIHEARHLFVPKLESEPDITNAVDVGVDKADIPQEAPSLQSGAVATIASILASLIASLLVCFLLLRRCGFKGCDRRRIRERPSLLTPTSQC